MLRFARHQSMQDGKHYTDIYIIILLSIVVATAADGSGITFIPVSCRYSPNITFKAAGRELSQSIPVSSHPLRRRRGNIREYPPYDGIRVRLAASVSGTSHPDDDLRLIAVETLLMSMGNSP
jgi:hypothetical protein